MTLPRLLLPQQREISMIMAITLLFSSPVTVECLPVPHPRFLLRSQLLNRPYALLVGKAISAFRPYWKAWRSWGLRRVKPLFDLHIVANLYSGFPSDVWRIYTGSACLPRKTSVNSLQLLGNRSRCVERERNSTEKHMELSERPSSSDKDCRTHYSFTRSEKINPEGWR
jgi:hypothetical protein